MNGSLLTSALSLITIVAFAGILLEVTRTRWTLGVVGCTTAALQIGNMVYGYGYWWWHLAVIFVCTVMTGVAALSQRANDTRYEAEAKCRRLRWLLLVVMVPNVASVFLYPGSNFLTTRPYSNAKATANEVSSLCKIGCTVVVAQETNGVGISAYLGGRSVFYVDRQRFGTFTRWGAVTDPYYPIDSESLRITVQQFENFVLITPPLPDPPDGLKLHARFHGAIWSDEDFDIYVDS